MGEVRGYVTRGYGSELGPDHPEPCRLWRPRFSVFLPVDRPVTCHAPSAYARLSPESFPNTDFTLPLPLTKEARHLETCLVKPECDSCENFQQIFHQHHREQQSLERPCVPGPCCSAKDCSSVPAAVLPRRQRPTHGTAPDKPHTRATQETMRLGCPGWGSEISTWTSDLGQHTAVLEIRSIRLF